MDDHNLGRVMQRVGQFYSAWWGGHIDLMSVMCWFEMFHVCKVNNSSDGPARIFFVRGSLVLWCCRPVMNDVIPVWLWSLLLVHLPSPLWKSLITFWYAAPCLWHKLPTDLCEPHHAVSFIFTSYHTWHHLHYHHFHLVLLVQSFILNLRPCSLVNPFHLWTFPHLPDWFHGLSDHLMFLFCSTAGYVCVMC